MSKFSGIWLIVVTIFTLTACRGNKMALESSVVLKEIPTTAVSKLSTNAFAFEQMSLKIKANYIESGNEIGFTINTKMIHDSVIWASVSAMGIEVSRALITKDSFKMIDRINRKYYLGSIEMLKNFTRQNFSLHQLQQLLVGNALFPSAGYSKQNDALRNDHLVYRDSSIVNLLILTEGFRIKKSDLTNASNSQQADVDYDAFERIKKNGTLPTNLAVNLNSNGRKASLNMTFVTVSVDPVGELSFSIPDKYVSGM